MQKIYLFLLLFPTFLFAQKESFFHQPNYSNKIDRVIVTKDNKIWFIGNATDVHFQRFISGQTFIGCLDSNFNQTQYFDKFVNPENGYHKISVFQDIGDDYILIGNNNAICDYSSNRAKLAFFNTKDKDYFDDAYKLTDTKKIYQTESGAIISNQSINNNSNTFWFMDSLSGESSISLTIPNGEKAQSLWTGKQWHYAFTDKYNWYLTDWEGANPKLLGNFQKNPDNFAEIEEGKKIVYSSGNKLFFIDFDKKTSKKDSILSNYANYNAVQYFKEDKRLYVSYLDKIKIYDDNFNLLQTLDFGDRSGFAIGFFKFKGKMYEYGGMKHYEKASDLGAFSAVIRPLDYKVGKTDATISNVSFQLPIPNAVKTGVFGTGANAQSLYNINFGEVKIKIKNTGTEAIKKVVLNTQHGSFAYVCSAEFSASKEISNLNIMPNEEKEVSFGVVSMGSQYNTPNGELCFWLSLVNQEPDANAKNDVFCKPFTTFTVATNELNLNNDVTVSPNPATDQITINAENEAIQEVAFSDVSGKIIFSQKIDNQNVTTLNVDFLPTGIYFLKVKKEKSSCVKKVSIQGK